MIFKPRFEWVRYPAREDAGSGWNEEYDGFRVKVRTNPSMAELRHEQELYTAISTEEDGEADYLKEIASRVIEWDFSTEDIDGVVQPVPAPGQHPDNWQAFYILPVELLQWVILAIRTAHVPKARTAIQGISSDAPGDTVSPKAETTPTENPPTDSSKRSD